LTRSLPIAAALTLAIAAAPVPTFAHHSFAMFDPSKPMTLKGVVKEFQWTNPHVVLWVYADAESTSSAPDLWSVEMTSPGNLTRQGWTRTSLKPGDRVLVKIVPLRNGEHGGGFRSVTNTDTGKVIGN
jgi:hypothetical protein